MAVTDRIEARPKMSEAERQARLDALFAKRDAAIVAGMIEIWDIDRINETTLDVGPCIATWRGSEPERSLAERFFDD